MSLRLVLAALLLAFTTTPAQAQPGQVGFQRQTMGDGTEIGI